MYSNIAWWLLCRLDWWKNGSGGPGCDRRRRPGRRATRWTSPPRPSCLHSHWTTVRCQSAQWAHLHLYFVNAVSMQCSVSCCSQRSGCFAWPTAWLGCRCCWSGSSPPANSQVNVIGFDVAKCAAQLLYGPVLVWISNVAGGFNISMFNGRFSLALQCWWFERRPDRH